MSGSHYFVRGTNGSTIVVTTDATLYTEYMPAGYGTAIVCVEFFSDAEATIPAAATAGTIACECTPNGSVYIPAGTGSPIIASRVASGLYDPPTFDGPAVRGRVTFSGITGAAYARVSFWRD